MTSTKAKPRVWSAYEKTQLARHGLLPQSEPEWAEFFEKYGQMPVEYITDHVDFSGLDVAITKDTLVPRIETEELVALAVERAKKLVELKAGVVIADVGTGCGAVGIGVALELESWAQKNHIDLELKVIFSDISLPALEVAKKNIANLLLPKKSKKTQVEIFHSDILQSYGGQKDLSEQKNQIDLIIANLPYIPSERLAQLDSSVKDYEPHLALDGGADGLKYIRELLAQAPTFLQANGTILLEVDYTHDLSAWREWRNAWQIELIFDQFTRNRFVQAQQKPTE